MIFYSIALALAIFSAGVVYTTAPLWARLARRFNLVDLPGARKIHQTPVPYGGGLAIVAAIGLTIGVAYLLLTLAPAILPMAWTEFIAPHWSGLTATVTLRKLSWLFAGAGCVFALGLVDDKIKLSPRVKLLGQIFAAMLAYYGGVKIVVLPEYLNFPLTIFWLVLITNAFNLLDNMDGLAASVALIAGVFLGAIMGGAYYFTAALIAVFVGALLGFLPHNCAPPTRKIFMGDGGAFFVGFLLATLTIAGNYYVERGLTHAILMPLILLAVPLFDTFSVIIIRRRAGKALMVGDNNHLSHRLMRRGFSARQAVQIIALLSIIFGLQAQLLAQLDSLGATLTLLAAGGVVALMAMFLQKSSDHD